jgi:hypothetical protein
MTIVITCNSQEYKKTDKNKRKTLKQYIIDKLNVSGCIIVNEDFDGEKLCK